MLNEFRETAITWDKANRKVYEPLRVSAGDNKGRKLSVQVVNGGVIEDLSGASLSLFWETKDKAHKGLDAFSAVNATKGEFEIYYTTGMLSNEGTLNANLVLVDTSGRVVSEPFTITVFKGIDDDAIQSSDSFTALTEALAQVGTINNKADRAELLALESKFEQNKVSVERQLQQNEKEILKYRSDVNATLISEFVRLGNLQTFKDAIAKGCCRIAFAGDSITGGGDYVEIDDRYVEQFVRALRAAYPDVAFEFMNFGIGGRRIAQFADATYTSPTSFTANWATVDGKPWRQYVRDWNPHLLFIGFGMNVNSGGNKSTATYLNTLQTYFNQFSFPSLILMSNLIPNKQWASDWQEREISSRQTVSYAKNNNLTLFDVFNKYQTLVEGKDESVRIGELYQNGEGITEIDGYKTTEFIAKDFKLSINVTLNADNRFIIYFRDGGAVSISSTQLAISGETPIVLPNLTGSQKITVTLDDKLKVEIGGEIRFEKPFYAYVIPDIIRFGWLTGDGTTSGVEIINYRSNDAVGGLTVNDLFGQYIPGDVTRKKPTGGNGVNHPSSIGYNLFYVPLIYDFIDKFNGIYKKESTIGHVYIFDLSAHHTNPYDFYNIPNEEEIPYLTGRLSNASGTVFKERKDLVFSVDNVALLANNEYLIRRTGGVAQIITKPQTVKTGWEYSTNVITN